ncbi:MAG: SIS domain-containing protein [Clostridia bacterium]|nr:SIS domain-containing protein [Clostridia bacterium]
MVKMWEEILEQPVVLEKCREANEKLISEIVKTIKGRNIQSVLIAARGTSDHAGIYGKYIIEYELGLPVALAAPSIFTIYKKGMKLENTLVIGISQSGKAADVLEVVKNAKENGALTITVTNDTESPLAKEAMFHLYCNAGLEKSVAATKTFTTEMYLIAQLVAEWSNNDEMKRELLNVPKNIALIFNQSEHITNKAERYRYINECFVLTRGINYPIAMETALKIQETTYVRAKAYATSDFYHGPFAMIEKDMPVFILAPEGPTLADVVEMIKKLKESQAELIIISNNKEVLEMGNSFFEIPATANDMISPFYNIVVIQMFACQLALTKGLNPDAPRGLKKVTITK